MSEPLRAFTPVETVDIMLIEAQNELKRCEITDRIFQRALLRGKKNDAVMAQNQAKISMLKNTIKDLEDIKDSELTQEKLKATVKLQ